MKRLLVLLCASLLLPTAWGRDLAVSQGFSFAVISQGANAATGLPLLQQGIRQTDRDNLAFVVSQGIKTVEEDCSDALYAGRRLAFQRAKNGLVVALTAADWASCTHSNGRSAAIERLSRLRDIFFTNELSFGATKLPLVRQSIIPKFRLYGENIRWEVGKVLFATLHLPANNNHYLAQAGRNSEFEDRQIANHDWLQKLQLLAASSDIRSIVLFTDANPLAIPPAAVLSRLPGRRDGFRETRRQLQDLARTFPGRILLIHDSAHLPAPSALPVRIQWQDNLGQIAAHPGWTRFTVAQDGMMRVTRSPETGSLSAAAQADHPGR